MQLKETLNRLCHANLQTLGKNTKGQKQQRAQHKSRAALASFQPKASWPKSARIVPTWRNNMMECPARLFAAPTCPVRQSDTLSTWTEFGIIENLGRRQECPPARANIGQPSVLPSCEIDPCAAQNFYLFLR